MIVKTLLHVAVSLNRQSLNGRWWALHHITSCYLRHYVHGASYSGRLRVAHLHKKFPTFYGSRKFITVYTRIRHLRLITSQLNPVFNNISLRTILILSFYLRLSVRSCLLPSGFPTKILHTLLFYSTCATNSIHHNLSEVR
jgi:hypothetical protein